MKDHTQIEVLISTLALGGLDEDEEAILHRERASHGADCEECRRLEAEYGEVAGRLAFALDPVVIPEGLEDRVVARTREPERGEPGRWTGRLRALVVAVAAVALFVGGWLVRDLTAPALPNTPELIRTATVVDFQGTGGNLSMAYHPGERGLYLFGSRLQSPPSGRVFELWMIRNGTPVRGTCFIPREGGTILTYLDASLGTAEAMAVTVEAASCPNSPTTQPFLTADLTADLTAV